HTRFSRDWSSDVCSSDLVDLFAEFTVEVLDGQPSSDYTVTYHHTQTDAMADIGSITSPYFVVGPGPETIWVRLENNDDPLICFEIGRASWRERGSAAGGA